MKRSLTVFWLLALMLQSCASVHPGTMGMRDGLEDTEILVSAEPRSDCSDDHYRVFVFTVENRRADILRVTSTDLSFDATGATPPSVLVGKDLAAWAEAYEAEQKNREHNKSIGQLALALGGAMLAIVGYASDNKVTKLVGEGALVASGAWALSDAIGKTKSEAQKPRSVPDTHVYSPFTVPIEKFTRRWAVIQQKPNQKLKKIYLELRLADDSKRTYAFKLED